MPRFDKIGRLETLRETSVGRLEEGARFIASTTACPQARRRHRRAQLPAERALPARVFKRKGQAAFRAFVLGIRLRREEMPLGSEHLRHVEGLAMASGRLRHGGVNRGQRVVEPPDARQTLRQCSEERALEKQVPSPSSVSIARRKSGMPAASPRLIRTSPFWPSATA